VLLGTSFGDGALTSGYGPASDSGSAKETAGVVYIKIARQQRYHSGLKGGHAIVGPGFKTGQIMGPKS